MLRRARSLSPCARWAGLIWVALVGCPTNDNVEPALDAGDDAGEATLQLGSGEASFEPAEPGEERTLYAGTQGGHHLWLSMRVRGLGPDHVRMVLDVVPAPPAAPAHTDIELRFMERSDPDDDLPFEFVGWPARVLNPECAVGQPVQLRVQLSDRSGHSVSAELELVAGAPRLPFALECSL